MLRNNTSGYKGVSYHKKSQKWQAAIQVDGRKKHLGVFATAEDAGRAYDAAARNEACAIPLGARVCGKQCPGGQPCVLDADVYHLLHCCADFDCECHGRQRYEPNATPKKQPPRHDIAKNEGICMELPYGVANRQETALETIVRGNH